DNPFPTPTGVIWTCSGGAIDAQGHFTGEAVGTYSVGARVGGLESTAFVEVADSTVPPPPPPPEGFSWQGTVPPQKWMNFYTKVLSRFASNPGMRLVVKIEVPPGQETAESKIQEAKAALRELGLSDEKRAT